MIKNRCLCAIYLITLLFSCNQKNHISNEEIVFNFKNQNWESNRITQFINDINYSATEVPLNYYLLKNLDGNIAKVDSVSTLNQRERIIEFEFQHVENSDLLQSQHTNLNYEDAIKYIAFKLEKDFKVITSSNDTIPCIGAHFERNFKVAPYKKLILYFNNINPNESLKLVYNDYLFNNGVLKFNFQEKPIKL